MTNSDSSNSPRPSRGGLFFLLIYLTFLIGSYLLSTYNAETREFTADVARKFFIAGYIKSNSPQDREYKMFSLEDLRSGDVNFSDITFLLPEKSITINTGDIHKAKILEDHGEWQLVAFNYSNTHTSTSIYRAYNNRVEPASYKMTSSVGLGFSAIILILPAFILSKIIQAALTKRVDENETHWSIH